jgi:hypothetical protein
LDKLLAHFWGKWPNQSVGKKCQNTYINAQFESSKQLPQTTFETQKYILILIIYVKV